MTLPDRDSEARKLIEKPVARLAGEELVGPQPSCELDLGVEQSVETGGLDGVPRHG